MIGKSDDLVFKRQMLHTEVGEIGDQMARLGGVKRHNNAEDIRLDFQKFTGHSFDARRLRLRGDDFLQRMHACHVSPLLTSQRARRDDAPRGRLFLMIGIPLAPGEPVTAWPEARGRLKLCYRPQRIC